MDFALAWLLTIAVETPILFLILRQRFRPALIVRNSIIANSLTLPFVWFFFPALGLGWTMQTASAEIFAIAAEAAVYRLLFRELAWKDALSASLLCNLCSFGIGLLLI